MDAKVQIQGLKTPSAETKNAINVLRSNNPEQMRILIEWFEASLNSAKNVLMTANTQDGTVDRAQGQALTLSEIVRVMSTRI